MISGVSNVSDGRLLVTNSAKFFVVKSLGNVLKTQEGAKIN